MRPFRKKLLVCSVSILVLLAIVWSLPSTRVEYHKWRLQSVKTRKARLLNANPPLLDRFWLHVTGTPVSGQELDRTIRKHQAALVSLGFLRQETLPAQMVAACPQTLETLDALCDECPWYDSQIISTNLLLTACPKMMDRWRKRAKELGW